MHGIGICDLDGRRMQAIADGKKYKIEPGTVYILDKHDRHYLRGGTEDMVVACAFNPPLNGREVHDENGVYPLDGEALAS